MTQYKGQCRDPIVHPIALVSGTVLSGAAARKGVEPADGPEACDTSMAVTYGPPAERPFADTNRFRRHQSAQRRSRPSVENVLKTRLTYAFVNPCPIHPGPLVRDGLERTDHALPARGMIHLAGVDLSG